MSSLHPCWWQCELFLACWPVALQWFFFLAWWHFTPQKYIPAQMPGTLAQMSPCSPLLPLSCTVHLGWVSSDFCLLRLARALTPFGFLLPEPLSGGCSQAGAWAITGFTSFVPSQQLQSWLPVVQCLKWFYAFFAGF